MKKFLTASALLVAAVWAFFARTAVFEYIRLDDQDYTFLCPFVKSGVSWDAIASSFGDITYAAIWMPMTYLSYAIDVSLFGNGPAAHHVVNVLLHSVNAVLVFAFLYRLFVERFGKEGSSPLRLVVIPALAAALWALNPMRAEPVCWVAGRKELLWTMFALSGLIVWHSGRWLAALCFCVLSCLSKPTAMCLPFLFLALDLYRHPLDGIMPASRADRIRKIFAYALTVTVCAATAAIAAYSQTHATGYAERELFNAPLWQRALNSVFVIGIYLIDTVLGLFCHIDNRLEDGLAVKAIGRGFVCLLGLVFCLIRYRRSRGIWFAFASLLVALAPTLGLFGSFGRESHADRFMYFPSVFVFFVAMMCWNDAASPLSKEFNFKKLHWSKVPGSVRSGIVIMLFFVVSLPLLFAKVSSWRNDYTVFSAALAIDPRHPRALAHVASEECARFHDFDRGINHFRESLRLEPSFDVSAQYALALANRGSAPDLVEVRQVAADVIEGRKTDEKGFMSLALGIAAHKLGDREGAVRWLTAALKAPRRTWNPNQALSLLKKNL